MKKYLLWLLVLLCICPAYALGDTNEKPAASASPHDSAQDIDKISGTYAFEKQLYMNPLSSFLAYDGYQEYYTLGNNTLTVTGQSGITRCMTFTAAKEPVDTQAYLNSFMAEGFEVPDISVFEERQQYTLTIDQENTLYRLYFLDNEIWLAQLRTGGTGSKNKEYFWSIYKIVPYNGTMPPETSPAP